MCSKLTVKEFEEELTDFWSDIDLPPLNSSFDRSTKVTASVIGSCTRQVAYKKAEERGDLELPVEDEGNKGIFLRGHFFEALMTTLFKKAKNWQIYRTGDSQLNLYDAQYLAATPDGFIKLWDEELGKYVLKVLEFKSITPTSNNRFPTKYVEQLKLQIALAQKSNKRIGGVPLKDTTGGFIISVEVSSLDLKAFQIEQTHEMSKEFLKYHLPRVKQILQTPIEDIHQVPTTFATNKCERYCRYSGLCRGVEAMQESKDKVQLTGEEDEEFTKVITEYMDLASKANDLDEKAKGLKARLRDMLEFKGTGLLSGKGGSIYFTKGRTYTKTNVEALKTLLPEGAEVPTIVTIGRPIIKVTYKQRT